MIDLFGDRPELSIELDEPALAPGGEARGKVRLSSSEERLVRRGMVGLLCVEECEARVRRRRSKGGSTVVSETIETPLFEREQELLAAAALPSGHGAEHPFSFPLPLGAPPSYSGGIVAVRWLLRAKLDVEKALDASAERELMVELPPRGPFPQPRNPARAAQHDELSIRIELEGEAFAAGEPVCGVAHLHPVEVLPLQEVRVELSRTEHVPAREGNAETTVEAEAQASPETELLPGVGLALPFRVEVPAGAQPSLGTAHAAAYWGVTVVCARRMRPDLRLTVGIHVYNGRGGEGGVS